MCFVVYALGNPPSFMPHFWYGVTRFRPGAAFRNLGLETDGFIFKKYWYSFFNALIF